MSLRVALLLGLLALVSEGPFPVVIYNHGSRAGNERQSVPFEHIGKLFTEAGDLVVVP